MSDPVSHQVVARVEGAIGHLTLDRPRAINALDIGMIRDLAAALDGWRHDDRVRVVLLDGAGDRGLCAGGDVRALWERIVAGHPEDVAPFFRAEYALNARIAEYPKPIVAIADGVTMGGGIGLAGHAGTRVVTERSKLAMPETRIGLTPDVGGSWLLARAPGRLGEYLGLTGAVMDAADAVFAGFANVVVPSGRLAELATWLGDTSAEAGDGSGGNAGAGTGAGRDAAVDAASLRAALADRFGVAPGPSRFDDDGAAGDRPWIDDAFAAGTVAEIVARLRARPEPAASATADLLGELSPTSLAVTLAAVRSARALPGLRAALAQEFGLVTWFAHTQPDLVEGIRAQLVDKDRTPAWRPASIAEVPAGVADEALAFAPDPPLWG
ncbi:enoyl-CoA hydratase/isomerase family protein [Microbacterium sp. No. 7]|uniref:enoyl-CoA hydratase/isomerase family protein n=1 Tax=Microbacterium sp. No. 7 TaxID=1714373 RepID=UPI0006CFC5C7|nr:enoyl-CoA hydratase/isomerase family protein [Microbacterium sp. No. 7]ALJ21718.1 3-hydroxyisobutyryl-CoA hydrolase [Microbacterium sp. No. 7]